ncbi:MAG TPA: glycosyltransferase, partial [Sphingomicrobium sp.]|nr:glycosyltransferase [Sphingomicrobium sp.]
VFSPVGVNATIVEDGVSGLLATDLAEWRDALTRLIDDAELRRAMGEAGRARAVESYSLQAHAPRLIEVLRGAVGAKSG